MSEFNFSDIDTTGYDMVGKRIATSFINEAVLKIYPGYSENIVEVNDAGDNCLTVTIVSPVYLRRLFWTDYILILHRFLNIYVDFKFKTTIAEHLFNNSDMLYLDSKLEKLDELYDAIVSGHVTASGVDEAQIALIYADVEKFKELPPERLLKFVNLLEEADACTESCLYMLVKTLDIKNSEDYEDMSMQVIKTTDTMPSVVIRRAKEMLQKQIDNKNLKTA